MKIIEICNNLPPEVFLQRHTAAIKYKEIELIVVARHRLAEYQNSASVGGELDGAHAVVLPNFDHLNWAGKLLALRHLGAKRTTADGHRLIRDRVLLGFLTKLKPDLIHFHNAQLAAMMAWTAKAMRIPYTVSLRGTDIQVFPLRSEKDQEEVWRTLEGASGIHTVCDQLGEYLQPWGLKSTTIYTVIPIPPTLPNYCPAEDGKIHFVSTGRLHWRKNYPALLRAVRDLLNRGVPARLKIIGSGEDEDSLRYWIHALQLGDAVELAGKGNEETIRAELGRAHAYVQSSIAEGLSNATAEAMAQGCPVFATDVGGTREVIRDGETGFLLDPVRPETWAEKLMRVTDTDLMRRVREQAFQNAKMIFANEKHAKDFAAFYERAMKG